jgi:hypothetical protein
VGGRRAVGMGLVGVARLIVMLAGRHVLRSLNPLGVSTGLDPYTP